MPSSSSNLFLDSLSSGSRDAILSACIEVEMPLRKSLYVSESVPDYAYFVTSGIASVVTAMPNGKSAEVGLIGKEGVVGGFHLLGPAKVFTSCFTQLAGNALKIPFSDLATAFGANGEVRGRILEFVQEQAVGLGQLAGCHRLHGAEERLSRWLLMAQDRTGSDVLEFTQEFLGMMLGAKRTTVTLVAGALQRRGLIEYRRGRVKIIDRAELEAAACSCYPIMKQLYVGLYRDAAWYAGQPT